MWHQVLSRSDFLKLMWNPLCFWVSLFPKFPYVGSFQGISLGNPGTDTFLEVQSEKHKFWHSKQLQSSWCNSFHSRCTRSNTRMYTNVATVERNGLYDRWVNCRNWIFSHCNLTCSYCNGKNRSRFSHMENFYVYVML